MTPTAQKFPIRFAAFFLFLITTTSTVLAEPSTKTVDQVKRGVVSIATFNSEGKPLLLGGGFFVGSNRIVTNIHVLKGATSATIRTFDGHTYSVEGIIALNSDNDLALIQTDTPTSVSALSLADNVESEGESVTLISSLDDSSWKVSSGVTSNLWYLQGVGEYLRITAAVRRGNSGSPIINDKGEVVGVAALHLEGEEELSFAVPGEIVRSLLSSCEKSSPDLKVLASAR